MPPVTLPTQPGSRRLREDPYILIYEKKLSGLQSLLPLLEWMVRSGLPLLIVAEDVESEGLLFVVNKRRGVLKVAAVKAPGFGDPGTASHRRAYWRRDDLRRSWHQARDVTIDMLGRAKRVSITKVDTTIVDGAVSKKNIDGRIAQIEQQIEDIMSDYDREKLQGGSPSLRAALL
jgi:chaperonin GroEL